MTKRIHLIISILFPVVLIFNSCVNEIEGIFYLSKEARKYQIDTTIFSFVMEDNYGISEEFYQSDWFYQPHNYLNMWGVNGKAFGEVYGIAFQSTINRFYFMFSLRADIDHTDMEIEWNQKDRFLMNLSTNEITHGNEPKVYFYESMTVRNVEYYNIIEVDHTEITNVIDKDTPVKTYISGEKGLIKFIRKDGVVFERREESN